MNPQMSVNYPANESVNQINSQSIILNMNIISELESLPKVKIVQDVECIDCLCPTCTQNKYSIINPTTDEKLFDFKEESSCPERFCCFGCRGFLMRISNLGGSNVRNTFEGEKGCSLPCLYGNGCGQPSIKITLTAPNHQFLGSVKMDYESCCCSICSHKIVIRDEKKNIRYHIQRTSYCIGCHLYICRCFPKACEILYHIYEGNQVVGDVKKLKCSTCFTFCPKGDNYEINFPPNANPIEKFLIINGVILLDYLSFFI